MTLDLHLGDVCCLIAAQFLSMIILVYTEVVGSLTSDCDLLSRAFSYKF